MLRILLTCETISLRRVITALGITGNLKRGVQMYNPAFPVVITGSNKDKVRTVTVRTNTEFINKFDAMTLQFCHVVAYDNAGNVAREYDNR